MNTLFTTSLDDTRIAYDRSGAGPALVLLHGGGSRRQEWHDAGYVQRLRDNFTVITLDLRGHGDSDLPTELADYTIDKIIHPTQKRHPPFRKAGIGMPALRIE
jgi:pimeloyl-ACP methyl ester carboxylesterase